MHRYYCEQSLAVNTEAAIEGSEAHHVLHVMRAKVGDRVVLFDGHGAEFVAEISATSRRSVTVQVVERSEVDRELDGTLTVASALPKGDRQKFLIEKLVELGTTRFVPLRTVRSVVKPTESVCERLRKSVIEASKQCGRNKLMDVSSGVALDQLLTNDEFRNARKWIAHPYETTAGDLKCGDEPIVIAVGPEGGFTDDEVRLAIENGWDAVSLGKRILRIETAAIVLAAKLT